MTLGRQLWAEGLGTAFLLATVVGSGIMGERLAGGNEVPAAVAAYITAAYWFTASTSFANPAVTLARALTDTFTGIRVSDVPGFVAAQLAAVAVAATIVRALPSDRI